MTIYKNAKKLQHLLIILLCKMKREKFWSIVYKKIGMKRRNSNLKLKIWRGRYFALRATYDVYQEQPSNQLSSILRENPRSQLINHNFVLRKKGDMELLSTNRTQTIAQYHTLHWKPVQEHYFKAHAMMLSPPIAFADKNKQENILTYRVRNAI